MILTAHQPTYLPWLGLFEKIYHCDVFVFFDVGQYLPKEWMSRNYVRSKNEKIMLTVPVNKKGFLQKDINEILINYDKNWQKKHLATIRNCYSKKKFFSKYFDELENIYLESPKYLSNLNYNLLTFFLKCLDLKKKIIFASKLNIVGKKSDLVLDMCIKAKCNKYIFGEQGVKYAVKEDFLKNNIQIAFQKYKHPTYDQGYSNFFSHLSVLDLIFNYGPDSLKIIIKGQNNLIYK
jgi:hypothetical protein